MSNESGKIQKWNPKTNEWEDFSFAKSSSCKENFPNIFGNDDYEPSLSECCRYKTGKKSFFTIGDMIEDNLDGNNWGIGIIVKAEKATEPTLYTKFDDEGNKVTDKYPMNQWKYLVDFPSPSETSAPNGEIWCWEFPMRELIDNKDFILHKKK